MIKSELRKLDRDSCPVGKALAEIGDKWVILILRECFFGFRRFEDFQTNLKISRSVLTIKLRRMVKTNLLIRNGYKKVNQRTRYEYCLTAKGMDLLKIFISFFEWGKLHVLAGRGNSYDLIEKSTGSPVTVNVYNNSGEKVDLKDIRLQFVK